MIHYGYLTTIFLNKNFHPKCNIRLYVYANVVVFFFFFFFLSQLIFIFPLFLGRVKYTRIRMNLKQRKNKN